MKKTLLIAALLLSGWSLFSDESAPKEFVAAFLPTELNLNPLNSFTSTEAQIYTALYEGLVEYDPASLDPRPGVARSWTISPDGKTYTFRLRDTAKFDTGEPVTADDFKNSWMKFLDPKSKAEYSSFYDIIEGAHDYRTGKNPDPQSVNIRVLAPNRLQVVLEEPATHFLKILCHHSFLPIHPSLIHVNDFSALPRVPGNGPYSIAERTGDYILLKKNPHYWDAESVKIESIRLLFVYDPLKTTQEYNNYEIHWVTEGMALDKVLYQDTIIVNPLFATQYFYFSNSTVPYNNGNVRRALALLVPWSKIRSTDFQFIPAKTLVPPIPQYPAPELIELQNKEEGLRLLSNAGYPAGRGLPTMIMRLPDGDETRRIASIMAAAWKQEIGLDTEILTYGYPDYFAALKEGNYGLGTVTWIGDFADPLTFLQMWTSTSNLNDAGYSNSEYDDLIKKSAGQNGEERAKTLSQAESILLKTGQVLPIGHSPAINLIDLEYIDGWYRNPLDIHPFKYLSFAPFKPLPGVVDRGGTHHLSSR